MSPFAPFLSPLFAEYSSTAIGKIVRFVAMIEAYGVEGVLTLRWKTLCRVMRLSTQTPDALLTFLATMEGNLLLAETFLDGDTITVEATHWLLPHVVAAEEGEEAEELELRPPSVEEAGRSRCQTKGEQNRRKREERQRKAELTTLLEQNVSQPPQTLPAEDSPLASDVTAFSPENEPMSQFSTPMSLFEAVTFPEETVTSAVTGHTSPSDPDQDRSDPDQILLQKDQDRDQDQSESKGSGETNPVTVAVTTPESAVTVAVTSGQESVTASPPPLAVTATGEQTEFRRKVMRLVAVHPEKWTEVEVEEALRRHRERKTTEPIRSLEKWFKGTLTGIRGEGFDQQRARMLQGAIPGGKATAPLKVKEPSPTKGLGEFKPPPPGALRPKTGTEG